MATASNPATMEFTIPDLGLSAAELVVFPVASLALGVISETAVTGSANSSKRLSPLSQMPISKRLTGYS